MDLGVLVALVVPGLATGLGGLPLLAVPARSPRLLDLLLGFTAGVMVGAALFGLLVPAFDHGSTVVVVAGLLAGTTFVGVLDRVVPHAHARFVERGDRPVRVGTRLRADLLVTTMVIHNIPEGLAVGTAFAAGGWEAGLPIAAAVAVQNIPEGFAAAVPVAIEGRRPAVVLGVAVGSGLVEPVAALLAYTVLSVDAAGLAFGLALAAGAMLYVVVDELLPEMGVAGDRSAGTGALCSGLLLVVALERLLG